MSALSRLPKTPASGIVHKWPPIHAYLARSDELAYGQVRQISDGVFLLVLAPHTNSPTTWDVMLLQKGSTEWAWESGHIQPQTAHWLLSLPLVTP